MDITELTVHELQEKLKNKELTVTEITKAYVDRINDKEEDVQAFVTTLTDEALEAISYTTMENAKSFMEGNLIESNIVK